MPRTRFSSYIRNTRMYLKNFYGWEWEETKKWTTDNYSIIKGFHEGSIIPSKAATLIDFIVKDLDAKWSTNVK